MADQLTGPQRELIVRLLAEFHSNIDIVRQLEAETGRKVHLSTIYWYRDTEPWKGRVLKAREALLANLGRIPIASKYWRLQELQRLYKEVDEARKARSIKTGANAWEKVLDKDFRACREMLRQAAEELGELREYDKPDAPEGPRQVTVNGRVVPAATAGLPDPGPAIDGEG